jgi:hypothetical protein
MVRTSYELSTSTGSDKTLELAFHWYETCISTHKSCTTSHSRVTFLPNRLIEIMPTPNNTFSLQLRVREDYQNLDDLTYATLSHRWARSMPFKLTIENFASCLIDIPFQSLSGVFQDAVLLAFRFKLRYIWIDSMCKNTPNW